MNSELDKDAADREFEAWLDDVYARAERDDRSRQTIASVIEEMREEIDPREGEF